MRRLILLRHAKSSWADPGASDHDRPLNRRGQEAAPKIGTYLNRHRLIPDCVLCSTARRARETWDLVSAEIPAAPPEATALLLVGHNPGIQDAATLLIAAGDLDDRERLREKLPTGALVVIDFAITQWSKLHPHAGRLERFVVPRMLEEATD